MKNNFLTRFFTTAPIFFPLIALFHIGLTLYEASNFWEINDWHFAYKLRPVVMLVYTLFWMAATYLRKWGATGYIAFSVIMALVYFSGSGTEILGFKLNFVSENNFYKRALSDILLQPLPLNILFSALALFFYRKMK